MAGYDPNNLKAFWEYCETFKGWAKLLIAGNAAALGYCLASLNTANPKYNLGAFILLFGAGLLLAGLYFLVLSIIKAEVTTAIVTQQRPGRTTRSIALEIIAHVGMWGSALAFAFGILLFAYRFWVL